MISEEFLLLARRIEPVWDDLDRVIAVIHARSASLRKSPPAEVDVYTDSLAINLHDIYVGLERIFEDIAKTIDRSIPSGSRWHQELLHQMTLDISPIRPAVLNRESRNTLMELLAFRHLVRHVYKFTFDPEKVLELARVVSASYDRWHRELTEFATFLTKVNGD